MALSDYSVAYLIKDDEFVHRRVSASAQQEAVAASVEVGDPEVWARDHAWEYGVQQDWIDAVKYAIETGVMEWGNDPGVINDAEILDYVQPRIQTGTLAEGT